MSKALIECVPNFSEGRRPEVIEAIVEPFRNRSGVALLDVQTDPDHNRLVVSLAGEPEPIQNRLMEAARAAISHIDMDSHKGAHPRIGAVDVIPFVPVRNITIAECAALAHAFGRRFAQETGIPVYFYEDAALIPERRNLENIRKGEYEALKQEIHLPHRKPDAGEPKLHPTAGATVIGARKFLIAFNVNLKTEDVSLAKRIAKSLRASGGGLGHVKSIGLALKDRGLVQVSINITDYEKNALYRVLEIIRMEARRWGVEIAESEIIGMVPAAALLDSLAYYLQMPGFQSSQVLELQLLEMTGDQSS
jgi:glutamate formiminotransferase